jgi:sialidase-1
VTTGKDTLLAFVLGAIHRHDGSPTIIFLRRSVDNGTTWSTATPVLLDPSNKTHYTGAAVVDPATNAVHYLYQEDVYQSDPAGGGGAADAPFHINHRPAGAPPPPPPPPSARPCGGCVQRITSSYDDGLSWTTPNVAVVDPSQPPNATWGKALASGIALTRGPHAGRLLVAVRHDCGCGAIKGEGSLVIYSDDHGATWAGGAPMILLPQFGGGWTECQVAELRNGSVLLSSRNSFGRSSGQGPRLFARSDDGGASWAANWSAGSDLPDPYCEASVVASPDRSTLFFANPSDPKERGNFSIHRSTDGGRSWPASRVLYPGGAAYSDVSLARGGAALGFLFERDNYRFVAFGTTPLEMAQTPPSNPLPLPPPPPPPPPLPLPPPPTPATAIVVDPGRPVASKT